MSLSSTSTADEVLAGIDLTGRVAVVTGATSGLGTETARALAAAGATVVLTGRNGSAGEEALASIRSAQRDADVDFVELDLAALDSVRSASAALVERQTTIDLLVNNAGVMGTPFERTADGFELQFGTNHVGHFLLTNLLRPALAAAPQARVVNVSSGGHRLSDIIWDDPNYRERPYDKWEAYGQSKTANILFTVALESRLSAQDGHAYAVHPGMVGTNLARYLTRGDFKDLMERGSSSRSESDSASGPPPARVPMKTIPAGAATSVWAATADLADVGQGTYLEDCSVGSAAAWATDQQAAARLWSLSEELVGQQFP